MRFGQRYSAPFGEPTKTLAYSIVDEVQSNLRVRFKPRTGYGDRWFGIYLNSIKQTHIYAPEGKEQTVMLIPPWGEEKVSVLVLNIGNQSEPNYDATLVARTYESGDSPRNTVEATFVPQIMGVIDDDDKLTNFVLTGYSYANNCMVDPTQTTRCYLDLIVDGTGPGVYLYNNGQLVAYGEGTGAVTLTAQNSSGLSGSVTVDPSVAEFTGRVYMRWPKSIQVLRGLSDPPTTVVATIPFAGVESVRWTETEDLAAETYFYRLRSISDTNDQGGVTASLSTTIPGPPEPPTDLAYVSGDYTGLVVGFTPSETADVTYNFYLTAPDAEFINLENPITEGITETTYGYEIAGLTYPGTSKLVIRAEKSGVEEKNLDILEIELDESGQYVPARPNPCEVDLSRSVVTGQTALLYVTQSTDAEEVEPEGFKIYTRTETGEYAETTADSGVFSGTRNAVRYGSLTITLGTDPGWYYVAVYAYADGYLSESATEYRIYVSDTDAPAPTNFTLYRSRG